MEPFDRCLSVVLGHEGQDTITDDPRDPGGLTRWGISAASHPGVDIRNLTREGAADIYRRDYWAPLHCDEMPLAVALGVFDTGVNMGTKAAARMLQECVGGVVDGVIGPRTLLAVYRYPVGALVRRYSTARVHRYMALGGFQTYGKGWLSRALDVAITAAEWATEG